MKLLNQLSLMLAGVVTCGSLVWAGDIPTRPEALEFPPLTFEPPHPSEYRVELDHGAVGYLIPDRTLPLINISVVIRVGDYLDPTGKEGLADMMGYLMSRGGIESMTAEELDERVAFLAAQLSSGVSGFRGGAGINLLSKDLDEGLSILREVLAAPRFQQDKMDLRKEELLQAMKQRNDDSSSIEARERRFLAFGEHFWSSRMSTKASIDAITREDLIAFHRRWVHPENFIFSVAGDFDRDDMVERLNGLIADWPYAGEVPPPVPTDSRMAEAGIYMVDKDVNQGRVTVFLPGIQRDDPDYFSCLVMNDVLGGGGFTSRLMNRIRSDEGLAYGAGSAFQAGTYAPGPFIAAFQSKSRTVPYATQIIIEEMNRIKNEPVSDEELNTAKRSFIDTFPDNFESKSAVAGLFANDEFTGRYEKQPDYWKNYRDRIDAITKEDVQRVAKKYMNEDRVVILMVGQTDEIEKGHPDYPTKVTELGNGRIIDVPLRDPFTMEPMTAAPKVETD